LHACTAGRDRLHKPSKVLVTSRFCLEGVHLPLEPMDLLLHRLTAALLRLQRHHLVQRGVRKALHLVHQSRLSVLELGAARLHLLRQPVPTLGLLKSLRDTRGILAGYSRDTRGMRQDVAEVLPHHGIERA
jgi:hypothetical protein